MSDFISKLDFDDAFERALNRTEPKLEANNGDGKLKFRKKPVEIEAMEFTNETKDQVYNFVTCNKSASFDGGTSHPTLKIQTLKGVMTARVGDWIIKGVNGEFYPCKPDIFEMTYDKVD